jgi:hypothetical protein
MMKFLSVIAVFMVGLVAVQLAWPKGPPHNMILLPHQGATVGCEFILDGVSDTAPNITVREQSTGDLIWAGPPNSYAPTIGGIFQAKIKLCGENGNHLAGGTIVVEVYNAAGLMDSKTFNLGTSCPPCENQVAVKLIHTAEPPK